MIQEAYCSFEIAKLLKEKGFKEPITGFDRLLFKEGEKPVLVITHQKAMRWLRETKDIHLAILHSNKVGYWFTWSNESGFYESDEYHKTYEEATEAALKYALEVLI